MSPYWLLLPVFLLCCAGSYLSYTDAARRGPHYVWQMALLGAGCAALFAVAARALDDKPRVYVFSLAYDFLMAVAYYLLPLAVFGVRLSPGVVAGVALAALGFALIKAAG